MKQFKLLTTHFSKAFELEQNGSVFSALVVAFPQVPGKVLVIGDPEIFVSPHTGSFCGSPLRWENLSEGHFPGLSRTRKCAKTPAGLLSLLLFQSLLQAQVPPSLLASVPFADTSLKATQHSAEMNGSREEGGGGQKS